MLHFVFGVSAGVGLMGFSMAIADDDPRLGLFAGIVVLIGVLAAASV